MSVLVIGSGRERSPSPQMSAYPEDRFATPDFNHVPVSPIAEPVEIRRMREDIGDVFNYSVEFTDRSIQDTTLIVPDQLSTSTIVALNLPWAVKPEVMRRVSRDLAKIGIGSAVFALEGTHPHPDATEEEIQQQLRSISIARTGYTHHRALDATLPNHPQLDNKRVVPAGASKGAAESYAMGNPKYAGTRIVSHIDSVAPPPFNRYTTRDVVRLARELPAEGMVIGKYVLKRSIDPDFWLHERKTLGFDSRFMKSVIHTSDTLFNADSGANFRAIGQRTHVQVDIHGGDIGTLPRVCYEEATRRACSAPTSVSFLERLRHMHIPVRLPFMVGRLAMYMEQSKGGRYPNRVDYEQVRTAKPIVDPIRIAVPRIPYVQNHEAA